MLRHAEHGIDRREDVARRAEREPQADIGEIVPGPLRRPAPGAAGQLELPRVGALEAVDRLLGVAHGEAGAGEAARAFARRELGGQRAQDLPLLRVGVLRLVDEDVIDAAVELVQDPGRADPREQVEGLVDQVVEVEGAEPGFLGLDPAVDLGGEAKKSPRPGERAGGAEVVEQRDEARLLVEQRLLDVLRHRLGAEGFGRARLVLVGEEDRAVGRERLARLEGGPRLHEPVGEPFVGALAGPQALRDVQPVAEAAPSKDLRLDGLDAGAVPQRQGARQAGERRLQGAVVGEQGAGPHGGADRLAQGIAGGFRADHGERLGEGLIAAEDRVGEHVVGLDLERLARLVVVEHDEAGRHVGLEREHVQQPLAQGVQRLDLEAPRRLDGAGEQAAGEPEGVAAGPLAGEFGELGGQGRVVQRHPAAEALEHPDRHVGGGRLGEGEAEDAAGRGAVEEQAQHPVGEHLGLARARIGRDPGREARVGRPALGRLGQVIDGEAGQRRVHAASPSPARDHSSTRARWSYSL
ncbi:hypothetical protein CHKEEEPN_1773 [Methylorubrum podarium]|nr:hypothetical protein CHKEEEPN_1773 [Methylorubrum podarium]